MPGDDAAPPEPQVYEKAGGGEKRPRERLYRILNETDVDTPLKISPEEAPWVTEWLVEQQPTPKVVRKILELRRRERPANVGFKAVAHEAGLALGTEVSKRTAVWACQVFEPEPPRPRAVRRHG